jgi:hypothetical protein
MRQQDSPLDPEQRGNPGPIRRQELARRIELGAGIAAAVLALAGLALLLFAPVLPPATMCPGRFACFAEPTRYVSALQAPLGFDAWALILAPALLCLVGAAGAVADAQRGLRAGLFALGIAASLAVLVCLAAATGVVGALYFPATLALVLAAFGAFIARSPTSARTSTGNESTPPDRAEP